MSQDHATHSRRLMSELMKLNAALGTTAPGGKVTINRTCARCHSRHKKCDGNGIDPCTLCVKGKDVCVYTKRRPHKSLPPRRRAGSSPKRKKDPSRETVRAPSKSGLGTAAAAAAVAAHTTPAHAGGNSVKRKQDGGSMPTRGGTSMQSEQLGQGLLLVPETGSWFPLKRCRLQPSAATGLVGLLESDLLGAFFGCFGIFPVVCQSTIRQTMITIMSSGTDLVSPSSDAWSGHDKSLARALRPTSAAEECMFWSIVGHGGILQGRPRESLARYFELATDAHRRLPQECSVDRVRACLAIALMHASPHDPDAFAGYATEAGNVVRQLIMLGPGAVPHDLSELMRWMGGTYIVTEESIDAVSSRSSAGGGASAVEADALFTEMEVRRFMFNLDARFTSATDRDASMACGVLGGSAEDIPREEYTSGSAGEPRSENTAACGHGGSGRVSSGRGEHCRVSDPLNEGHDAVPPAFAESRNTWTYLRGARRYIDGMKHVVARPNVRAGVGGTLLNWSLFVVTVANGDVSGALGAARGIIDVVDRYPGLARTLRLHRVHALMLALSIANEWHSYDRLRQIYNTQMCPFGQSPMPPIEHMRATAALCDNFSCRLFQRIIEHGFAGVTSAASASALVPTPECTLRSLEMREYRNTDGDARRKAPGPNIDAALCVTARHTPGVAHTRPIPSPAREDKELDCLATVLLDDDGDEMDDKLSMSAIETEPTPAGASLIQMGNDSEMVPVSVPYAGMDICRGGARFAPDLTTGVSLMNTRNRELTSIHDLSVSTSRQLDCTGVLAENAVEVDKSVSTVVEVCAEDWLDAAGVL